MSSRIEYMSRKGIAHPPKWLPQNVHYEVIMGSQSYGCSVDNSDMDVYGFAIPPKDDLFPHLRGEIPGFGNQIQRFEQYQEHHLVDKDAHQEYDFSIYSIVKFFQLCMENNPNMCDSLFVPQRCVLFASPVGQLVRDNRKMFLHKGSYHKFRGYAYAMMRKIGTKANASNPKRQESINRYGYDIKFAYNVVRLALEGLQILEEHDLDIERDREIYKSIRRGDWTLERLKSWFEEKEKHLEEAYNKSTLRNKPDEEFIKNLLLQCLEHHYGSMKEAIKVEVPVEALIRELNSVLDKYK